MNKYQALHEFWNGFNIPAYEENSVPKTAEMPYITYEVITDSLSDNSTALSCQVWYRANTWKSINAKVEEISQALAGGVRLTCDDGYIIIYRDSPFAQNRAPDEDNLIKCKYVQAIANYITT